MLGFPGSDVPLENGEVLCNPAPGSINPEAREAAGVIITSIDYRFYNDRLYQINMTFMANDYTTIKTAFNEKYGPPAKVTTQSFQNGFGARWTGELLIWEKGDQSIGTQ